MRFKAPEGRGNPTLHGKELSPEKDGLYHVHRAADIEVLCAHGYVDADAPRLASQSLPNVSGASADLRAAVRGALQDMGVTVHPDAPAAVMAKAIRDAAAAHKDRIVAAVKDTELRLQAQPADKPGDKKK